MMGRAEGMAESVRQCGLVHRGEVVSGQCPSQAADTNEGYMADAMAAVTDILKPYGGPKGPTMRTAPF